MEQRKIFSKIKFLETVNAEKQAGIISQKDIDFALVSWVNAIEGLTPEEIGTQNSGQSSALKQEWFIEEGDV